MIDIRRANTTDAGPMAELRWEFRAGREPAIEARDVFVKRCTAWMRSELQATTGWRAWVALKGNALVGQIWVLTISKIPNPGAETEKHAYVSNLYVKPSDRGGTGTRLLDAVLMAARADGCDRVVLWPTDRSVTLYRRHGFTHGGDVMELRI